MTIREAQVPSTHVNTYAQTLKRRCVNHKLKPTATFNSLYIYMLFSKSTPSKKKKKVCRSFLCPKCFQQALNQRKMIGKYVDGSSQVVKWGHGGGGELSNLVQLYK